jgi:hypothetical protein
MFTVAAIWARLDEGVFQLVNSDYGIPPPSLDTPAL